MKVKPASLIAAGAAVALATAMAVPALTGASPAPTTITVQEKVQAVVNDDIAPKSKKDNVSLGDRLVTRQALFDASKKRVGTLYTDCAGVGPTKPLFSGATLLCTLSYRFTNGQIVAAGMAKLNGGLEVPIVAGTGAYAGAHGSIKAAQPAKGFDSADVITISG